MDKTDKFFKINDRQYVSACHVRSITKEPDGSVVLDVGGGSPATVSADLAGPILALVEECDKAHDHAKEAKAKEAHAKEGKDTHAKTKETKA